MRKVPRHRPPVRDFVVELTTVSRNIEAQIVMTSRGTLRSTAGNLFLDLLSVHFSPQYDRSISGPIKLGYISRKLDWRVQRRNFQRQDYCQRAKRQSHALEPRSAQDDGRFQGGPSSIRMASYSGGPALHIGGSEGSSGASIAWTSGPLV
ncbi:hypothetical protein E4U09_006159 [Claviceps aff. purpurea]|uniref:Uncharacterized protein n=1 Tax=Claviceps aff. purpurea TaxID=1967640 RepID=A0A9P7QNQ8_9HYPO|nr:hypothetical protein E4U09_006159 [Claviceps aff. purpurea]